MNSRIGVVAQSAAAIPILHPLVAEISTIGAVDEPDLGLQEWCSLNALNLKPFSEMIPSSLDLILMIECPTIIVPKDLKETKWLNLHSGLLPKWRGHSANSWALLNDESVLGFSLHVATEDFDAGPVIAKYEVFNDGHEEYLKLRSRAIREVAKGIRSHLLGYLGGTVQPTSSDTKGDPQTFYCSKLRESDGVISDFRRPSRWFHNLARLFVRSTTSDLWLKFGSKRLNVLTIKDTGKRYEGPPNRVLRRIGPDFEVKTLDGSVTVALVDKDIGLAEFRKFIEEPN